MELERKAPLKIVAWLLLIAALFSACRGEPDYAPKPRGYFRIYYPEHRYKQYTGSCPYTFMYPAYGSIEAGHEPGARPCWSNLQRRPFNGTLHLSYEAITSRKKFNELVEDAHTFAFKHTVKASSINEGIIRYPDRHVYGIYYTIEGNAASSAQFFLTDSNRHYIRGALYFNTEPRLDSIQPVLNFVKQDLNVLIKSFRWK